MKDWFICMNFKRDKMDIIGWGWLLLVFFFLILRISKRFYYSIIVWRVFLRDKLYVLFKSIFYLFVFRNVN